MDRIDLVYAAVSAELKAAYGDQEPLHYGSVVRWRDGGPSPLDGISIFRHSAGHWHYTSSGLTEREEKESANARVSGWGFELTLRLRAHEAPLWPIDLLNDVARYVWSSRTPLAHGHYLELGGNPRSRFWGVVADPGLRPVHTVNGSFHWLQLVALSEADFRSLQGEDYEAFLRTRAADDPWFVS